MSVCLLQSNEREGVVNRCNDDCASYIKNESCVVRAMKNEVQEIHSLLRENKKKLDVLAQINDYITEALNAESSEVCVK